MSSISDFFFGSKGHQVPSVTPQQSDFYNQLINALMGKGSMQGPLGMGFENIMQILSGKPEAFEAFEKPAREAFEKRTIPGIAERFSGVGGQRSSAFGQQLGQAGADLETQLSSQRAGLQSQALNQLMQLVSQAGHPQVAYQQGQPGSFADILKILATLGTAF